MLCMECFGVMVVAGGGCVSPVSPLFRRRSLPMRPFGPPGQSVRACIRPPCSSPLELLTHNLLLAPPGIC